MGTKKLERSDAELYMEQVIKDGRARKDPAFSMKKIGYPPDPTLQVRVNGIDVDNVKRLAAIKDNGYELYPITLFEFEDPYRVLIGNGFNRHEVYRLKKLPSIPAWIIRDTMENALVYAACANLEHSWPLTKEDQKRACFKMFENPELFEWNDVWLGERCGLSSTSVKRHRAEFCKERNVESPDLVKYVTRHGTTATTRYKRAREFDGDDNLPNIRDTEYVSGGKKRRKFLACVNGRDIYLGNQGLPEAKRRLAEVVRETGEAKEKRVELGTTSRLKNWLEQQGIRSQLFVCPELSFSGIELEGAFCVSFAGHDIASLESAIGRLLLLSKKTARSGRLIVCAYEEDLPPRGKQLLSVAVLPPLPFEFMSPKQLVAGFGPKPDGVDGSP